MILENIDTVADITDFVRLFYVLFLLLRFSSILAQYIFHHIHSAFAISSYLFKDVQELIFFQKNIW